MPRKDKNSPQEDPITKCESSLIAANPIEFPKILKNYKTLLHQESEQLTAYTLRHTLEKSTPAENATHVDAALTQLSNYIINNIVNETDLDKRVLMIERYIHLMQKANENSDYMTVGAIYNALHHEDISRLKVTFDSLSSLARDVIKSSIDSEVMRVFGKERPLLGKDVLALMDETRGTKVDDRYDKPLRDKLAAHPVISDLQRETQSKALLKAELKLGRSKIMTKLGDSINSRDSVNKRFPNKEVIMQNKSRENINAMLNEMVEVSGLINLELQKMSRNLEILSVISEPTPQMPKAALS